jgi:hypothetical protein
MAKTLTDAIEQVQAIVGAISGIKRAPHYPPDKMSEFPFAIAFPASGTFTADAGGVKRGLHRITLEIHTQRKNLARDVAAVIDYGESVSSALLNNLRLNNTVDTINQIAYEFGPLGYDTVVTLGYTFTIDVKIIN